MLPSLIQLSLFLLVVLLAASGCRDRNALAAPPSSAVEPRPVETLLIEPTLVSRTLSLPGTLAADEQVVLALKATGLLAEVLVDLGTPVRAGQVIARLAPYDFELQVAQAEGALAQARARLGLDPDGGADDVDQEATALVRQAKAVFDEALLTRDRLRTFVDRGLAARSQLDAAEAALAVAEGRYQDAQEEIRSRQAVLAQRRSDLALARQQLEDSVLRSPIDGMVRERHALAGEYRAAGTPIATVVRVHPLRLQLAVPERAAPEVRIGQAVRLSIDGDDTVHEGRVARLGPAIEEGSRTLPIEATVPNPRGLLRPGTFVKADLVTREEPALLVPRSAILTFVGVDRLLVVNDGLARERRVRLGEAAGDRVEVLEGLEPGEAVILSPGNLADGTPVLIS